MTEVSFSAADHLVLTGDFEADINVGFRQRVDVILYPSMTRVACSYCLTYRKWNMKREKAQYPDRADTTVLVKTGWDYHVIGEVPAVDDVVEKALMKLITEPVEVNEDLVRFAVNGVDVPGLFFK